MSKKKKNMPPYWALKFLRLFIKQEYIEEIEGDLEETYQINRQEFSTIQANWVYVLEVFKLLRPNLIKSLAWNYSISPTGMYKSHFKTSVRGLKKNLGFSAINIFGLSLSIAVGILMILLISELYSFDDFHTQKDQIYKVTTHRVQGTKGSEVQLSTASYYIGNQLKEQVPGIEDVVFMRADRLSADFTTESKAISINGFYTSASFFDVFSFKLLQGNPQTSLSEPNSVVITQSSARKLFGDTNPMGQVLNVEENEDFKNVVITGVVADPPINSHMRFDALVSLSTVVKPSSETGSAINSPDNTNDVSVYLVQNEQAKTEDIIGSMANLMVDYNKTIEHPIRHSLQPMETFVTSNIYTNRMGPMFSERKIKIMLGLMLIILISACFNYTNLSMARALKRSKEVGIRKVMGASRSQVFTQFIMEALVLAFFALLVGLVLFFIIRPQFLNLPNPAAMGHDMFSLKINYIHIAYFIGFTFIVGLLAGFQPAFLLSKYKALNAFQDASTFKLFSKGVNLRQVLTGFQFAISIGLIVCAVLVFKQYKFSLDYDLGYSTESIVNIPIEGDYINLLEAEIAKLPEVLETSKSSWVLGVGGDGMSVGMVMSKDNPKPTPFLVNQVDDSYLSMHELSFLAGSGFTRSLAEGQTQNHVIINEKGLQTLGLDSAADAIGKTILYDGNSLQIQGVVKDFISIALTKEIFESFAFVQANEASQYKSLNVKISSANLQSTLAKLEVEYRKHDAIHPFEAHFYDDQIAKVYEREKTTFTIVSFLAFLAISISTLGLLGMAVYTLESRKKEISIRKVLGAKLQNLFLLLSREFLIIVLVSSAIVIPVALYIVDSMVLNDFIHRIEIKVSDSLSGLVIMLSIGLLTIGWQIRTVFIKNPTDALKNQ
ncbi:ABC transporter permease [Croceitalea marina]